jgi:hypothetical protein
MLEIECPTVSADLSLPDRLLLDHISQELDDPDVPTERLLEMLSDLTAMARRHNCEISLHAD